MLKDQSEKQLIISKVKNRNFKNLSFRNLLDGKSIEFFNEINKQDETVDYSRLDFVGSSKKYTFSSQKFYESRKPCRKYIQWQHFIRCCKTTTKENGKYA